MQSFVGAMQAFFLRMFAFLFKGLLNSRNLAYRMMICTMKKFRKVLFVEVEKVLTTFLCYVEEKLCCGSILKTNR